MGSSISTKARFDRVARRAAESIVEQYPGVVAVIVDGSVGRGKPQQHSDIDLMVLVKPGRRPDWFTQFVDGTYVTVGFTSVRGYREEIRDWHHFLWARGGAFSARPLYDPEGIARRLLAERRRVKTPHRIQEKVLWNACAELVEYTGKLRNGWLSRDAFLVRYAAAVIAQRVEEAVLAVNDISPRTENEAWHLVMHAKRKPPHLVSDYPIARGLRAAPRAGDVHHAGLRLARETLRFVQDEFGGDVIKRRFRQLLQDSQEHLGL